MKEYEFQSTAAEAASSLGRSIEVFVDELLLAVLKVTED